MAVRYAIDERTGAADRIPLTNPGDWNARIHVANSVGKPYPRDREFWAITDEGQAVQVSYHTEAFYWTGRDQWGRTDGESGSWEADELVGWSDDQEDAEEAAALFLESGE